MHGDFASAPCRVYYKSFARKGLQFRCIPGGRFSAYKCPLLFAECEWSSHVSLDKSLKVRQGSSRARNVLKRAERIAQLREEDRFDEGRSPFGLPKTRVRKAVIGKKKKKKSADDDA